MSDGLKGLKIKDGVEGKVLTVGADGVAKTSDKDVSDIASASELEALADRVSLVEGTLNGTLNQLEEING